ncbi:hypothetical protein SFR_3452 [Streptomyces sp. FR-008]|nr:hypothetical protein SFR_3452 [Streptomyces sp. FR-008]
MAERVRHGVRVRTRFPPANVPRPHAAPLPRSPESALPRPLRIRRPRPAHHITHALRHRSSRIDGNGVHGSRWSRGFGPAIPLLAPVRGVRFACGAVGVGGGVASVGARVGSRVMRGWVSDNPWGWLDLPCPAPQAPGGGCSLGGAPLDRAGHGVASGAGRAVGCRGPPRLCGSLTGLKRRPGCWVPHSVSTVPVKDWPQTPAGLWGSRFLLYGGGVGPRRGTSSQTARCGVSRFKTAVCAVCCGGTPTRPHPTVSYAANRRRVE